VRPAEPTPAEFRDHAPAEVRWLGNLVRSLRTSRTTVPAPERVLRAAALVPIFGARLVDVVLRDRLGRPVEVLADSRRLGPMPCRLSDLIPMYIELFDVWEPDVTACIESIIGPGDGLIDVGANVGYVSLLGARLVGPTGRVLAIEAAGPVFRRLEQAVRISGHDHVRAVHLAASDRPGELRIDGGPSINTGRTRTVETGAGAAEVVEARPLVEIATDEEWAAARLIKIDVEGAEPAVLAGIVPGLERLRADAEILVELNARWWPPEAGTVEQVLAPFRAAGFRPLEIPNSYWPWRYLWPGAITAPRPIAGPLPDRPPQMDVLLTRREITS